MLQVKLVFVGSCRDNGDLERVKDMKDLTKHLSLEDNVEFKVSWSVITLPVFSSLILKV